MFVRFYVITVFFCVFLGKSFFLLECESGYRIPKRKGSIVFPFTFYLPEIILN